MIWNTTLMLLSCRNFLLSLSFYGCELKLINKVNDPPLSSLLSHCNVAHVLVASYQ